MRVGSKKRGISLTEVLIGILLLALAWTSAVGAIIVSRYSLSYAKHKTQAVYVAQKFFEEGRRWPYDHLSDSFVAQHTGPVSLDTNGTFNDTTDDFAGHSAITILPIAPSDPYRTRIRVEINWNENFWSANKTVREYFTTDISNENVLR